MAQKDDEQQKSDSVDEDIEDLEPTEAQAEDVRGGYRKTAIYRPLDKQ